MASNQFLAITGPSGSGKSTLLNLIGTLDKPSEGKVTVCGVDIKTLSGNDLADFRRQYIGFIFQLFHLLPTLTALENVMLPLLPYRQELEVDLARHAEGLLETVGLVDRLQHLPGQLSGGEQQRVAIARALVNRPKLILADEPTGNLDSKSSKKILHLLRHLNQSLGLTVILVTHDSKLAKEYSDDRLHLKDGQLVNSV